MLRTPIPQINDISQRNPSAQIAEAHNNQLSNIDNSPNCVDAHICKTSRLCLPKYYVSEAKRSSLTKLDSKLAIASELHVACTNAI